ncbi:molecular chaperone HtpG [candidate division WOR-3 bacterium]|nr:molecular chaperone HtpG [candidate division WOR-3 bacterium]
MDKHDFKTETKKLLDLVIHSLYSKKEIFLRELISNSSDAINRLRFLALTEDNVLKTQEPLTIEIIPDSEKATLTIKDNGIGMTKDEIEQNLGTIARSGTRNYLEKLSGNDLKDLPDLIGQFGVGFYSAFMVAEKIEVFSKSYLTDEKAVFWTSDVKSYTYEISDSDKNNRGTEVILHLNPDDKEFLQEWKLTELVKRFSDFVEYPIMLVTSKEKKQVNSQKALWQMQKSDVKKEEYNEFYKSLSLDFNDPLSVIHYRAEGKNEFTALAYIPSEKPPLSFFEGIKSGMNLYINRILILSHSEEILPHYLSFVSGIIDSADLPLNISREMLQENRKLMQIRQNLTKKILSELKDLKSGKRKEYEKFFQDFGHFIKEGVVSDSANRETLLDLLLFPSSSSEKGEFRDLNEYVSSLKEDQKEIYYLVSDSYELAKNTPSQEMFKTKGYEVLYLLPGIDEILVQNVQKYKDLSFVSVSEQSDSLKDKASEEDKAKFKGFLEFVSDILKDDVKEAALSSRLVDSPACIVREKGSYSANLEKVLRDINKDMPLTKPVLEINPSHSLINKMLGEFEKDRTSNKLRQRVRVLFDLSLLLEGSTPKDIGKFTDDIVQLIT